MKKVLGWSALISVAAGLGIAAAASVAMIVKSNAATLFPSLFPSSSTTLLSPSYPLGQMPGRGPNRMFPGMMGPGGMWNWGYNGSQSGGQRISIDQAADDAKNSIASYGSNLVVSEVMEFSNNFYVLVKEAVTGRGAFELLVDP